MPNQDGAHSAPLPSAPFSLAIGSQGVPAITSLAHRIAAEAVTTDLESYCVKVQLDGRVWWDTRPMTDAREHSHEHIDMATAAIQYAIGSGLAAIHPQRPYLLHINNR